MMDSKPGTPVPGHLPLGENRISSRRLTANSRWCLVLLGGALLFGTACATEPPVADPGPPNILLISLDALRADHLGCYGYDRSTSPFLDRLATRGTRFSHASVNTHGTPPSHTTMLSSLYQETHRVGYGGGTPEGRNDTIPAEVELVQEMLQAHDWHTLGVTGGGYMSGVFGFSRGFDSFSDEARSVAQGTDMLLEQIRSAMVDGRPIFAMYHTYEIHSSYEPPPQYRTVFGEYHSDIPPTSESLIPLQGIASKVLDSDDFDFLESQYDGEIRYTDDVLESFFAQLESIGFLENALIIITSDHGEEFGDHGGLLHRATLYEELLHIPLILIGPMVAKAVVDPQLVSLIDITPTILEAARLPTTDIMEGESLLNRSTPDSWRDQRTFAQYTLLYYSVRTPRWKLIHNTKANKLQLFNLRRDPTERRNVIELSPATGDQLYAELDAWRDSLPHLNITNDRSQELSTETIEELRALGYVTE